MKTNYRSQPCCSNCAHHVAIDEHDCETAYYCGHNAPPRPLSGSVCMGEGFTDTPEYLAAETRDERLTARKKYDGPWTEWTRGREVAAQRICDDWVQEK